jgi:hypothetical protein
MKRLITVVALGLFALAMVLGSWNVAKVVADCAGSPSVVLDLVEDSLLEGETSFSFVLEAAWAHPSLPTIGVVQMHEDLNFEVKNVAYNPAYFFPTDCIDSELVVVTGEYDGGGPYQVNSECHIGVSPNHSYDVFAVGF